jgi:hypothetical protein
VSAPTFALLRCRLDDEDRDAARRRDRAGGDGRRPRGAGEPSARVDSRSTASAARRSTRRRRADRRDARRVPRGRRRAAGSGRRSEVGHDRPRQGRGPSRACSACARASACSRTCGPCARSRPCTTPARCGARDRRHRPAGRARADRRDLLRRQDAHATWRSDVCEYSVAEIERIARVAFAAARTHVTSVDKANVLETSGCGARS